jgi:branched-chain amino acid transport system ATP-binding protein
MPASLDVRSLEVAYGRSLALSDVDLVVPRGTVVGVLGPNGAGKSTLLNTVAGLVPARSGQILYESRRIDGLSAHQIARAGVCLIPEGRGILPALTVVDNLKLALPGESDSLARVFEQFPVLRERRQQSAGTLSGGEQQMLALARAFGRRTELLMVDEPSLGLAPRLVGMVADTIAHLHDDLARTVVWVEQYAGRVLKVAHVVYILGRGRVVWAGEPSELRASPVLQKTYLGGVA